MLAATSVCSSKHVTTQTSCHGHSWWPQNNGLRGAQLTLRPQQQQRQDSDPIYQHSGGSTQLVEIEKFDAQVGIVLEVHGGTGVLVETVPVVRATTVAADSPLTCPTSSRSPFSSSR